MTLECGLHTGQYSTEAPYTALLGSDMYVNNKKNPSHELLLSWIVLTDWKAGVLFPISYFDCYGGNSNKGSKVSELGTSYLHSQRI
jgi:hypothetical protein